MAASSLREKFKLLRQWQMQQQEEFERIKTENTLKYNGSLNASIIDKNHSLPTASDIVEEDAGEEGIENIDDESGDSSDFKGEENGEVSSLNKDLLQRMSAKSLEQALHFAVNELKAQKDLMEETQYENQSNEENSDNEHDDTNYFANDSWNGNTKLQTAVFKGVVNKNSEIEEQFSDEDSEIEEVNQMDGFYPIIYSEDNASQGDADHISVEEEEIDQNINHFNDSVAEEVLPIDEKPIQSKMGKDVLSFEELIERQLEAERKSKSARSPTENATSAPKKKFLRKGDGVARFVGGGLKTRKAAKRPSNVKGNNVVSLPKTTLKLNAEPKNKNERSKEISANNFKQAPESAKVKGIAKEEKQAIAQHSTRHGFSDMQPVTRKLGFQRNNATTIDSCIEASFQKMVEKRNAEEKIAEEELAEFELLEKVALDTSISSNASSVLRLVAANKSNIAHHNTSSPIPKGIKFNQGIGISEIVGESDESLIATEDDSDHEVFSDNDIGMVESKEKLNALQTDEITDVRHRGSEVKQNQFSDNSAWDDTIQSSDAIDDGNSTIVESPNAKKLINENQHSSIESSPPTSKLMRKFFPKLNTKDEETNLSQNARKMTKKNKENLSFPGKENAQTGKENMPPSTHSDILKSKLAELEHEISRFKNENTVLEKLRLDKEKELANLRNEVQQFQEQRAEELKRIEKFRDEEMQKLRREKKTFEKYQKAVRSAPNKKERDEIEALKQQVNEIQDELKRRETKWNGSASRFRKRIEDLENENYELKESMKLLENERLQRWAKTESQNIERKEKAPSKVLIDDVTTQEQQSSKQLLNHPSGLEIKENAKKVKLNSKKSISPRIETEKSKNVGRVELIPRKDVAPYEQPETPREVGTKEVATDGASHDSNVRLSITPERQPVSTENTTKNDAAMRHQDGKVERILPDGSREIMFPNGTRKTINPTNQHIVVSFFNGDIKQIFPDGRTVYFYAESKTTHTTYKDGTEVFEFSNGQSEKHYPDGRKVITFHDQTVKCIFVNGAEETVFADGTIQNVDVNGQRTISFPNGQREIHTQNFKRREYPDGTVKTVYQDGRQETRYSTGRIRIKDQSGNVILDTGLS